MAITRSQKVNLGIFVTVSLGLLVLALIVLIGLSFWEGEDPYQIRYSAKNVSFSGLDVGSPVKYSGIQIGRVAAITIDPRDVSVIKVELEVKKDTPIAADSVASLGSIGITGLKYVEISRGSQNARLRKPGEEIPSAPSVMDEITGKAAIIAQKTEFLLNKLNTFLDDNRQKEFWDTIAQLKQLAASADTTISSTGPAVLALSQRSALVAQDLHGIAASFQQLLAEISPNLKNILRSSEKMIADMAVTRDRVNDLLAETKTAVGSLNDNLGDQGLKTTILKLNKFLDQSNLILKQSEEEILLTLEHLRETSENLDDFSVQIRENPSLLLRTKETEEREIK